MNKSETNTEKKRRKVGHEITQEFLSVHFQHVPVLHLRLKPFHSAVPHSLLRERKACVSLYSYDYTSNHYDTLTFLRFRHARKDGHGC